MKRILFGSCLIITLAALVSGAASLASGPQAPQAAGNASAPPGALRYHIVWSSSPIRSSDSTLQPGEVFWWAANPVAPSLTPSAGAAQSWSIATPGAAPRYAAIFSFDAADNMSAISNLALTALPSHNQVYLPRIER